MAAASGKVAVRLRWRDGTAGDDHHELHQVITMRDHKIVAMQDYRRLRHALKATT